MVAAAPPGGGAISTGQPSASSTLGQADLCGGFACLEADDDARADAAPRHALIAQVLDR